MSLLSGDGSDKTPVPLMVAGEAASGRPKPQYRYVSKSNSSNIIPVRIHVLAESMPLIKHEKDVGLFWSAVAGSDH